MATNILTHERKQLPSADQWELVVDEEEAAFVGTFADGRKAIIVDYEQVMTKKAYETDSGELMSMNIAQPGAPATSLTTVCCRHRRGKLILPPMGNGGGFDLHSCVFMRPRSGKSKMCWCVNDIHRILRIESFGGCPSLWLYRSKGQWDKYNQVLWPGIVGDEQFVHGIGHTKEGSSKGNMWLHMRCSPFPALSTASLLHQCLRWHALPRQSGGFAGTMQKQASGSMFRGFIALLSTNHSSSEPLRLPIDVTTEAPPVWPRPVAQAPGASFVLEFSNGMLDIKGFKQVASSGRKTSCARKWWTALQAPVGESTKVDCWLVVVAAVQAKVLVHFLSQLLLGLAAGIEAVCGKLAQAPVTKKRGHAQFQWLTIEDIIKLDGIEQYLVQYMGNVTDTFDKQCSDWHFNIATDKGQVNSLKLQDSIIALPNNQAWLCAPVVPWGLVGDLSAIAGVEVGRLRTTHRASTMHKKTFLGERFFMHCTCPGRGKL